MKGVSLVKDAAIQVGRLDVLMATLVHKPSQTKL